MTVPANGEGFDQTPPPPTQPQAPVSRTSSTVPDLSIPQRQSPLAVIFLVLRFVRSIGIVQIVIGAGFVLSRSPSLLLLALGIVVVGAVLLLISGLGWWRYTFEVSDGELRVEQGVISRQRLTVPLDRVQAVSIQQKFLHRLVGLVQVSADTAGTAQSEFTIDAVKRPVAEALQRAAADYRSNAGQSDLHVDNAAEASSAAGVPPAADREILRRTPGELFKVAVTQLPFSGLAVIAPLFAFSGEILDRLPSFVDEPDVTFSVGRWLLWFIPLAIVAVLLFSVFLNIVRVFLVDWNLTVTATASGLRKNAGLLSKSSTAASLPRLQLVRVSQSWLTRLVGMSHVSLIGIRTAAAPGQAGEEVGGTISVPGSSDAEVAELRRLGLDNSPGVQELDRRVSHQEIYKDTRNAAVLAVLLAGGLFFTPLGLWSLLFLFLIPVEWLTVRRRIRLHRWGVSADAIANQNELLTRTRSETLLRKVNSVTVRQSLFERKRNLATLVIELAGTEIAIGMIPIDEARAVRDRALFVAETDRRAFM